MFLILCKYIILQQKKQSVKYIMLRMRMKLALVRGQYMKIGQINEVNRALVALSRLVEHGTHHGTIGSICQHV